MEKIRKYETFYSINHKRELNFILLEHDYQKYINDMYCPWCLEAELFYRNPKNRVAHLVLKNSSKHSENCRLSEKSDKITEEDLGVPPTFPTKPTLRHKMEKYLIIHSL